MLWLLLERLYAEAEIVAVLLKTNVDGVRETVTMILTVKGALTCGDNNCGKIRGSFDWDDDCCKYS